MKSLLLDLDGTVIVDQARSGRSAESVSLLPGAAEGLARLRDAGVQFFIFSNQGGIARGEYSEAAFRAVLARTEELLAQRGVTIASSEYCPHSEADACRCRKPETGMWDALCKKFPHLRAENCVMVGDKDRDIAFGKAIGCMTARIRSSRYPMTVAADTTVGDIDALADLLLGTTSVEPPRSGTAPARVMTLHQAAELAAAARGTGKTVVTTNGAFDLLHPGHRFLLSEARALGDVLIVGVNSDASVRRAKGPGRPIESEVVRAEHLTPFADAVFIFSDDDPRAWLQEIRPSVHVNASTYGEDCIEAPVLRQIGARLHLVPVRPELGSTTALLRSAPP